MSGYRYVGPHRFYGIPTRDLTDEEYRALPALDRRKVRTSPAYLPIPDAPPAPPAVVTTPPVSLAQLTRSELDTMAAELGVEQPGDLKNKDEVVAAIEAAQTAPPAATGDQEGGH